MLKRIVALGVMLVMLFGFAGCSGGKGIWFIIGDIGDFSAEAPEEHPVITKLIKSVNELQRFCDESGIRYGGEKYDESYFNEKALLVYSFVNESISITIHIDSLKVDNETMTINITRRVPRGGQLDAVAYRFYAFEVNQSDIAKIDDIQISRKDKYK